MLQIGTIGVGALVAAIALLAIGLLGTLGPDDTWTPVVQDVLTTAYQALAIGALGGLAKLLVDKRKEKETADAALRERRQGYLREVTAASHDVDNAMMLVRANRSVLTWTKAVGDTFIPARTRLRAVAHDLTNWQEAGLPVFDDHDTIEACLDAMYLYLSDLIEEHAGNKQRLGVLQKAAENSAGAERQRLLDEIWDELRHLPSLGGLVDEDEDFDNYRTIYLAALDAMRRSLRQDGRR